MQSWTKPTDSQVARAISKLGRPAANRYFFQKLNNPEWIEPLHRHGYFRFPPSPVRDEKAGTISFPYWPDSGFLVRMAALRPELVASIVRELPETENIRVRHDLVEIALQLPPKLAVEIEKRAKKWVWDRNRVLMPHKLSALVSHLVRGGEVSDGFELAWAILTLRKGEAKKIRASEENGEIEYGAEPMTTQPLWDYSKALETCVPALLDADGPRTLDMLCDLLLAFIKISYRPTGDDTANDYSSIWRDAVESQDDRVTLSVGTELVNAVRNVAMDLAKSGRLPLRDLLTKLEDRKWTIFRRIALYILSEIRPAGADIAAEHMLDPTSFKDYTVRHEYGRLLGARFGELTPKQQEQVIGWIMSGPNLEVFQRNVEQAYGRAPTAEETERYQQHWKLDWLLALADNLPESLKSVKAELVSAIGLPKPKESVVWVGPTSPKETSELRTMTVSEVIAFLKEWQPFRTYRAASPEGLARQLQVVIKERAQEFAAEAELFVGLRPTYVRALLGGITDAIGAEGAFSWDPVIQLCDWAIRQPRGEEQDDPILFEDKSWVATRMTVARLLSAGFEGTTNPIPIEKREIAWSILAELMKDPDPSPQLEARSGKGMDTATLAINSVRGTALQAVLQYALWLRQRFDREAPESGQTTFERMPEVREVLDTHLDTEKDPSVAIRSIYGQYFPWLILLDADWARRAVGDVFPETENRKDWWRAAWHGYIDFCQPFDDSFPVLRSKYEFAIRVLGERKDNRNDERAYDRLGAHLMTYYWRGLIGLEPDGLVARFFAHATSSTRGAAIDFVGRSLANTADQVPLPIINRLTRLWEARLAEARRSGKPEEWREELGNFASWFICEKFDEAWGLTQLQNVLEIIDAVNLKFLVTKQLAKSATKYPRQTIECLRLLLRKGDPNLEVLSASAEMNEILRGALNSGDTSTREVAADLIHQLGEFGGLEFGALLTTPTR